MEILGRWGKNNIQKFWNAAFHGFHIRRYDVVLHVTKFEAKFFHQTDRKIFGYEELKVFLLFVD